MATGQGRGIQGEVEQAREAGDFWGSIKLAQDAIKAYQEEKDKLGLAEVHGSIALAFRHLFRQTEDKDFLVLAEGAATTGIEIAKINGISEAIAMPTFNLAKVQEELGQVGEAVETYQDAVDAFTKKPPKLHNRAGVLADMKIHLYTCLYKVGDKSGLPKTLTAIEELEKSNEKTVSKYNYDVWLSGGHMKLAEILREDDNEMAKKHLEAAKKIIDGNKELKIRKEQWEKLNSTFSSEK